MAHTGNRFCLVLCEVFSTAVNTAYKQIQYCHLLSIPVDKAATTFTLYLHLCFKLNLLKNPLKFPQQCENTEFHLFCFAVCAWHVSVPVSVACVFVRGMCVCVCVCVCVRVRVRVRVCVCVNANECCVSEYMYTCYV